MILRIVVLFFIAGTSTASPVWVANINYCVVNSSWTSCSGVYMLYELKDEASHGFYATVITDKIINAYQLKEKRTNS